MNAIALNRSARIRFAAGVMCSATAAGPQATAQHISDYEPNIVRQMTLEVDRATRLLPPPTATAPRLPIFFPPDPPPLEGSRMRDGAASRHRIPAPDELAAYVGEPFYAALGTRLSTGTLSQKLRQQLESYRAERGALVDELRAELERLRPADAAARRQAWAALAVRQGPRLAAVEQQAEQLRVNLVAPHGDWRAQREWALGQQTDRGFSPAEVAQVMRAYASYENSLLPAQRRLLREIAIELLLAGDPSASAAAAPAAVFFPPEPARVVLPADLPADLAARLALYQTKKATLKKELYDTITAEDGMNFGFLRVRLSRLPEKQAAALTELEQLAEQIRVGLAQLPVTRAEPPRSRLPPALTARLHALMRERATLHRETTARVVAAIAQSPPGAVRATYSYEPTGLHYVVVPLAAAHSGPAGQNAGAAEKLRAQLAGIAEDYGRRVARSINDADGIYREAAEFLGSKSPATIDAALQAARRAAVPDEKAAAFQEYRLAVLEPGLSPGQRRLLFAAALEKLELPLPAGQLQPTARVASP